MIEVEGYVGFERVREGGAGIVYRAVRRSTGAAVAVKVLRDVADRSIAWHRMRRELTALVALGGHANVVQVLELIEHELGPALVMEYVCGGSIAELMTRRDGELTVGEVASIGSQVAAALAAAHAEGIVHRDVKPQNLLIDADGQVKLCDFGIALLTRTEEFGTRTEAWSLRYASPEDLDGDVPIGPPSDVYSLGATLLHLVHGAPPTLRDRLAPRVPPPTGDPQLAELDAVLAACLHTDPANRPSATQLVDRLGAIGEAGGLHLRASASDVVAARDPDAVRHPAIDDRPSSEDRWLGSDADETLRRPGGPRSPNSVRPGRRRRRWPLVAGVLVSTLVVSGGAALIWPGGGDRHHPQVSAVASAMPAISTTVVPTTLVRVGVQIVERPPGIVPVDDPTIEWPFGDVGECLVQLAGFAVLQPVACSQPHDLQRYAVGRLEAGRFPPQATFDLGMVEAAIAEVCAVEFDQFVATDPVTGRLGRPVTRPSAATFRQGDRRYQCLLGADGHRLVGDAGGHAV
jgi:serine/threonine protein kinase